MAVEKIAVSMDPELVTEIRCFAEASGENVSRWLADAARRKIRGIAARAALADYEAEYGRITDEEIAQARKLWLA
jgi:hypothetical protein